MPGLSIARVATAFARKNIARINSRMASWETRLARWHFLPLPIVFFPIVKRFAVDLVNSRLADFHFAWLSGQKEINVVGLSIRPLHIHASEVFPATEVLQAIIVYFYQVQS